MNIYELSSYDYDLPPENIAQSPASPRDSSRLLVWNVDADSVNRDLHFRDIVNFFSEGDVLVLNDTKVIPARLRCSRQTGGLCEVFLLKNLDADFMTWQALVKPARKIHRDSKLIIRDRVIRVLDEFPEGIRTVKFEGFNSRDEFMSFLDEAGQVPLPPYIKIKNDDADIKESYQTVFAKNSGSVAAPTASLHFTPELLEAIKAKGVKIACVTLHVGLGTFRPVMTQDIREHDIHSERCEISDETAYIINSSRKEGHRIIASGTTAARTLESFSDESGIVRSGTLDTRLYIYPGYKFKTVDALITNFHLPQSSLIMLVAAFASCKVKAPHNEESILAKLLEIYTESAREGWRFFSFGDAMFIL